MALAFSTKRELIEVVDELNGFTIKYDYTLLGGLLSGAVNCNVTAADGRRVMHANTTTGENFHSSTDFRLEDDFTGLPESVRAGLIEIHGDPSKHSEPAA